jgi:hypothetical protein
MHPEEFTDTDPRAMEVWLELLRRKAPGERLAAMLGLANLALKMAEAGVRKMHPQAPTGKCSCALRRAICRGN